MFIKINYFKLTNNVNLIKVNDSQSYYLIHVIFPMSEHLQK